MAETTEETAGSRAVSNTSTTGTVAEAEGENGQAAANPQPAQQNNMGFWPVVKTLVVRCVIIYMITSFIRGRGNTPPANESDKKGGAAQVLPSQNLFTQGTVMDMYVFINEEERFTEFNDKRALFWSETELVYGDWTGGYTGDGSFEQRGVLDISENVQNNKSIYLHVFFVKAGKSPNPDDEDYSRLNTVYKSKRLNKYKKRKYQNTFNLLTGETAAHPDIAKKPPNATVEVLSHWHPNLTLNLVFDHTPWSPGAVPAPLDEYIEFDAGTGFYKPIIFFNDYWNLNNEYMPINSTTPKLNITLTYSPISLFKWQMYAAQTMRSKWYSFMGDSMEESDEEQDTLKQTFLDTNPYLLGLTIIVSLVHSVFEFLAFKNDIQFWRNRKTLEGLSVRSVIFSVFQSVIVLLYVLDNDTNFVVRVSVFIGLGIEIWKIQKVLDFKIKPGEKWLGVLPKIEVKDKSTYIESNTKKYDKLAFSYLSWLLYPLLVAYAIYSVIYLEHKSWYSWVLNMMYGFLLTFGFIMMTPQLFINYKLKSVAHLPWRMLTYKALNTFIDDLFAFVIKMPTLYRLGCFRDDIIFLIYLYQRYIYKVDLKRVNEFGVSGEPDMNEELDETRQIESSDSVKAEAEASSNSKKND